MVGPVWEDVMSIKIPAVRVGVVDARRHAVAPVMHRGDFDALYPRTRDVLTGGETRGGHHHELDQSIETLIIASDREPRATLRQPVEPQVYTPAVLRGEGGIAKEGHEVQL